MNDFQGFLSRREWAEKEGSKEHGLRKAYVCDSIKAVKPDDESDTKLFEFVISTSSPDRHGDTVDAKGWVLDNFFKGGAGPVLFAHDSDSLPVGKSPLVETRSRPKKLVGQVEFASEIDPFAAMVEQMVERGFLKSASVGFQPIEFEFEDEADYWSPINFKKQELLEFSIVPVPANPDCVLLAKEAGIDLRELDKWARKALDMANTEELVVVPKANLEACVKALGYGKGMKLFDLTPNQIRQNVKQIKGEEPEEFEVTEEQFAELKESIEQMKEMIAKAPEETETPAEAAPVQATDTDEDELTEEEAKELAEMVTRALNEVMEPVKEHFTSVTGQVIV